MQYTHFMDKYPAHQIDIPKSALTCTSVDEIMSFFREKVDGNPLAVFIAEFDHYAHTKVSVTATSPSTTQISS